jgi:hypothetical protein
MGRKKNEMEAFVADLHDIMDGAGTMKDTEIADAFVAKGWCKRRTASWVTTTETEDGVIQRYTHRCTDCNYFYKTVCPRGDDYCHKCGARMKGV